MVSDDGCPARRSHSTTMAEAAAFAARSCGATTPRKLPSRTTVTPANAFAFVSSTVRGVAATATGRMTRPNSMFGRTMSGVYACWPVTNARPSTLCAGLPRSTH